MECTPIFYPSIVFTFGLVVESIKEFKGASLMMTSTTYKIHYTIICDLIMPMLKLDKPRRKHKKIAPHNLPPKHIDFQSLLVKWKIAKTIIICSSRWTW